MHDAQIRAEIRAQIAAKLPSPTKDSLYVVFTPPHTEVVDQYGTNSVQDFVYYHDYAFGSEGFAYVVIPYDDSQQDARVMTTYASGALAAAVTDPEASGTAEQVGWYDDNYGEVEAIPFALAALNLPAPRGLSTSSSRQTAPVTRWWPCGATRTAPRSRLPRRLVSNIQCLCPGRRAGQGPGGRPAHRASGRARRPCIETEARPAGQEGL